MASETITPAIRLATGDDATLLAELGAVTFSDTFAIDSHPDELAVYLAASFSVPRLAEELADSKALFLIAEVAGRHAGYAKLRTGKIPSCVSDLNPIEIERLYVRKEFFGTGIAQALMTRCLELASERGHQTIWLGVWERNARAQAFYHKCGFQKIGEQVFLFGKEEQTDWVMGRGL